MSRQVAARFATAAATGVQPPYGIARLADGAPPHTPPTLPPRALSGDGGGALAAVGQELKGLDWPYILGGYAGAFAVGGLIGFTAQGGRKGAITGGVAAGAVWTAAEAVYQWRAAHWGVGTAFLAWSGVNAYVTFRRIPR